MPCSLLIFCQSIYLMQIVNANSNTEWQTVRIQISLLLQKSTFLDVQCLQRQGISGFSGVRLYYLQNEEFIWCCVMYMCRLCGSFIFCSVLYVSVLILSCNISYASHMKNILKFLSLYSILIWPKFCFLCSCYVNYLVKWQIVLTLIRLLLEC